MLQNQNKKFDLVCLGEPLIRLSPPNNYQLRKTDKLDLFVAGSQANVASNFAQLGGKSSLITKVPLNPLGLKVIDTLLGYGVDVTNIKTELNGKIGITYVEFSSFPRDPIAIYDRKGSSASTIEENEFDWKAILSKTIFAYTDGIFPGLNKNCYQATLKFLSTARENNCTTCFDINYREHLWGTDSARQALNNILKYVDILVTNRFVSEEVMGFRGSDEEIMNLYSEKYGCKIICFTYRGFKWGNYGEWFSKALCKGRVFKGKKTRFQIVDRYGTGDAWFSGFLFGYLKEDIQYALDFGNTLCALAHTIKGDVACVSAEEVEKKMSSGFLSQALIR